MTRKDSLHIPGAYSLTEAGALPVTGERHPLRREAGRWLAWGAAVTVVLGLAVGAIWAWQAARAQKTPRGHEVKIVREEPKFFPGAYGPLRVMPELSIDNGTDTRNQEASRARKRAHAPPREAPLPPTERGELVPPRLSARGPIPDTLPDEDPDLDLRDAVEMRLPAQLNPCYVLERLVRPEYPLAADARARHMQLITVEAAFYVNERGLVTGAYILQSSGQPLFDDVVLRAVDQWRFKPVEDPDCPPLGFWVRLPVLFRAPHGLRRP